MRKHALVFCIGFSVVPNLYANKSDWPQWGGSDDRNMVSDAKDLPDDFDVGKTARNESGQRYVDMSTTRNILWAAKLGSQTYGNPTISDGKVFVGTNDDFMDNPRFRETGGGRVLCFSEETGVLLWQLLVPRFRTKEKSFNYDDGHYGVCSSPNIEGERVYLVSNRAEVLCLDVQGQANGNDGPFMEEAAFMTDGNNSEIKLKAADGDIIWRYDMIKEVPSWPQDASNCSVLLYKDRLFVCTSNGVDKSHRNVPFPDSPTVIVLDKHTGRLLAQDNEKINRRLFHGNWSNPSLAWVNGKPQVLFGGGDGFCYAFDPEFSQPEDGHVAQLRSIWKCDCNPSENTFRDGQKISYEKKYRSFRHETRGRGPSEIISTPVCVENRVYVTVGQDPLHGRGDGALTCIDATKEGDISNTGVLWVSTDLDRSMSTVSVADGLVYAADYSGDIHCFDAVSGQRYWVHETSSPLWSSTLVADGKVYFGTENRDLWILKAGTNNDVLKKIRLPHRMYGTPVVAGNVLYIASQQYLYAVKKSDQKP